MAELITKHQLDGLIAAEENGGKFVVLGKPSTADFGLAEVWEYNPLQWVLTRAGLIVALQEKKIRAYERARTRRRNRKSQSQKKAG